MPRNFQGEKEIQLAIQSVNLPSFRSASVSLLSQIKWTNEVMIVSCVLSAPLRQSENDPVVFVMAPRIIIFGAAMGALCIPT